MAGFTHDNTPHLIFFEIESDSEDVFRKFDHLVVHDFGKSFDFRYPISYMSDSSRVFPYDLSLKTRDLLLNLFDNCTHTNLPCIPVYSALPERPVRLPAIEDSKTSSAMLTRIPAIKLGFSRRWLVITRP